MSNEISKQQAVAMLWHKGVLTWKLQDVQKDLYNAYLNAKDQVAVWNCSRRLGKSYALCVIAIEQCLKKPNSIVKFIAPTAKQVKMIINPLFKEILKDCPKSLRPTFKTLDSIYRFPNGSEIQLAGTDGGHVEGLRGGSSDLCIVDEAGFCNDLKYIVQSILLPTTTTTNGKIILSSTTPTEPDHEFFDYMEAAEKSETFVKKTIYDNKMLTQETIERLINQTGGEDSPDWKREFLCERIRDEDRTVIPEFTDRLEQELVKEWPRPAYYDAYVAGDIGFKDMTVMLFAYYDFKNAKLIIEDEIVTRGKKMTMDYLSDEIKKKEQLVFSHPITKEPQTPYLRICDNNLIVINELQTKHNLLFLPTAKDDKAAALNNVRIWLRQHRIIINPKCKVLISHLKNAKWNKNKDSYARSPGDQSHYDAVDALVYLVRNIQPMKNPYPANYGHGGGDDWFQPVNKQTTDNNNLKKIFKVRKSLGFNK